ILSQTLLSNDMGATALLASPVPVFLAGGALTVLCTGAWALRFPKLATGTLILSLIAGQLFRVPLPGQGGGLLVSDVATVLVLGAALLQRLFSQGARKQYAVHSIQRSKKSPLLLTAYCLLSTFILWSLFILLPRVPDLGLQNFLVAFLYWLRLTTTLALFPALLILFRDIRIRNATQHFLVGAVVVLVVIGFLQLVLLPNLGDLSRVAPALAGAKWDPHQGRLFSTWLDPNLFGGLLIIVIPWIFAHSFLPLTKGEWPRFTAVGVLLAALLALLLTQSRSSFLALGLTFLLLAPAFIWQLQRLPRRMGAGLAVSALTSAVLLIACVTALAPSRLAGLLIVDETAALRVESLAGALFLSEQHPYFGVGYNAYQFAAAVEGLSSDFTIHSRAGADNSWLTLAVTTGVPGAVLFFLPWVGLVTFFLSRAFRGDTLALGAAGSLMALFLHSQVVNSFLYNHLLITLIVITTLCLSTKKGSSSSPSFSPPT
ncbi:MAG: O-antigen ligase family protein, partial [Patescibacteria group bacterium]